MAKFIDGEMVRVVGDNDYCRGMYGKVYPVFQTFNSSLYPVQVRIGVGLCCFREDELELAFKGESNG